ncbi:MAG: hypothetical protein HKN45_00730 [Flavobacteriales bacterium]|nr:hypothetical protein [Flavobacteriales bacterium]
MSILKSLLIGSQLIGLLLMNVVTAPKGVEISHDVPSSSVIGSEHWVYVNVKKTKVSGFAKFQVDVPKGFQIEPGDLKGASFTFAEGTAKIIWMSLPPEDEFQFSYKLTIYDDCEEGNNIIAQRFAYLDKNDRKLFDVPDHTIYVGSENISNQYVPDTLANGVRTITQLNGDHYLIQLDLYKDGIKGFAKIEELIPEGMNAEAVKKSNAVFTQIDNKVKFVWFSIPQEDSISVVYEVFASELVEGGIEIDGEFTYLRNNQSKSVKLFTIGSGINESIVNETISESLEEENDTIEKVVEEVTEIPEEIIEEIGDESELEEIIETPEEVVDEIPEEVEEVITEVTEPDPVEVVIPDPEKDLEEVTSSIEEEVIEEFKDITDVPSPENGVAYRVQIAAGKNIVDEVYFQKRHNFTDAFSIENHESWIKYTTGSFSIYRAARDKRNQITDGFNFDGPFVTAYNDGKRITVQEALMITSQKWYQ